MNEVVRILLVEDEKANVGLWNDAVATFNADFEANGFEIASDNATSVAQAKHLLAERRFDAVIVDLRLKSPDGVVGPNDDGNTLIRHLIDTSALGIVVYTGQAAEFVDQKCTQVRVLDRANGLDPVFEWIKQERPLFKSLNGAREAIEREVARVFFSAIWPRWKVWSATGSNDVQLQQAIARHLVAHVHDVLLSNADAAHFEESYFLPPVKPSLDTGDLVENEDELWVLVTPRCDLANPKKTVSLLFARCKDIGTDWTKNKEKGDKGDKAAMAEIQNLQQHRKSFREHFLPPMFVNESSSRGPWLVQFDDLKVCPIASRPALTDMRFASMAPQYVPSLVERFGAYFSRIGTPNFSG